jgi:hypothetical protein
MPAARSPEFRRRAVELARLREKPIAQMAKDLGIAEPGLWRWMAQPTSTTASWTGRPAPSRTSSCSCAGKSAGPRWRTRSCGGPPPTSPPGRHLKFYETRDNLRATRRTTPGRAAAKGDATPSSRGSLPREVRKLPAGTGMMRLTDVHVIAASCAKARGEQGGGCEREVPRRGMLRNPRPENCSQGAYTR